MKRFLIGTAAAVFTLSATAALADSTTALAGVENKEVSFQHDGNRGAAEFHVGNGDVIFVRARTNRWYRIALNDGCLNGRSAGADAVSFEPDGGGRIDRSSRVSFTGDVDRTCLIDSIRRSAAPPQVDSNSVVTLD